jgi:hypothetical protein
MCGVRNEFDRLGGLPTPTEAEDIWGGIWSQEAHNSTAIEGDTLVLFEVELLLPGRRATEGPGSFRRHGIRPFPGGMTPPDWPDVPAVMHDRVAHARELRTTDRPLPEAIAELHSEFERIHPFLVGNGRTGRLLVNLLFIRLGYPPAIIQKRDRDRYLHRPRTADAGDPGPLGTPRAPPGTARRSWAMAELASIRRGVHREPISARSALTSGVQIVS